MLHNTVELDQVGVCWDADLVRIGATWQARNLRGSAWTVLRGDEAMSNRLNAYRVLLTRARIRTVVWVPRGDQRGGDQRDATRDPAAYDAVADHLLACGIADLDGAAPQAEDMPMPDPVLL